MTTLSRRHLVTTAAALPALALPPASAAMASTEHDPVIAMVENCRAAWAGLGQICKREPVDADGKLASWTAAHDEWEEEQAEVLDEHGDLEAAIFASVPRTKAGAVAMIRYQLEINHDFLRDDEEALLTSLLSYLDAAA